MLWFIAAIINKQNNASANQKLLHIKEYAPIQSTTALSKTTDNHSLFTHQQPV
jgi:hypothetical protein